MSTNSPILDDTVQKAFEDGRRHYNLHMADSENAALLILRLKGQLKQAGVKEGDYSKHYQISEEDKARMLGTAVGLLYTTHPKDPSIKYAGPQPGLAIRAFQMALIILKAIDGLEHPEVQTALEKSRLVTELDPIQQRLEAMEMKRPSIRYQKPTAGDLINLGSRYADHHYNNNPIVKK